MIDNRYKNIKILMPGKKFVYDVVKHFFKIYKSID